MFEISKYKKSNVKISIRLPENMNDTLKKIAKKENMSFNNVIVSCIQNSLDEMDLNKYKNIEISEPKERPCTLAKGSTQPTTTRGMPVFTMSRAQGGVLP